MKPYLVIGLLVTLMGCKSYNKMTGNEKATTPDDPAPAAAFYVVACCQDNDGLNNLSWPSFLPQSHIDLCVRVKQANHDSQMINGEVWLAMGVDCERDYKIGSQYYKGHGY